VTDPADSAFALKMKKKQKRNGVSGEESALFRRSPTMPSQELEWGHLSPMVTHHMLKIPNAEDSRSPSDGCMHRNRSRSLGNEYDYPRIVDAGSLLRPIQSQNSIVTKDSQEALSKRGEQIEKGAQNPLWISFLYGLINAAIVLPVLMSFGSIIYRDEAFGPYMPVLIKLTVISGMMHQICFSALSSLPFAVGQVQDAGLIFLSGMAANIVQYCKSHGHNDEALLATVTIGLSISTALLGIGLAILGKLQLAQYVQMLPVSVIAGYLAFIGWFCGVSGFALMANGGGASITLSFLWKNAKFILPGLIGGLLIYLLVRRIRHMAVLPSCIFLLISGFYTVLLMTGTSVESATEYGWIRPSDPPPVWYHTWDYLAFDKVVWSALPPQALTLIGMIFVVALSSSLDVAAIELELNEPLNYNSELTMVGLSNVVSGLTGGYTGSYIFSQSIFSLRAGITSRVAGFVLAFCELLVLILPFNVLSFIPNFFFGSLLIMICIDLMFEWLWDVRKKVTQSEYAICLGTFGCIQLFGVEYGIIVGVVIHIVCQKFGLDTQATPGDEEGAVKFVSIVSDYGSVPIPKVFSHTPIEF